MNTSSAPDITDVARSAFWANNVALVQLLGICPLLAVTTSAVNGLGLGIATLVVVTSSNVFVSLARRALRPEIRIPAYVLIIAALVTCIEMLLQAWFPALSRSLGIFVPLIVTNCAIVARAEAFASRQPVWPSFIDGLATGSGFAAVLLVMGALRELVGQGTVLAQLDRLIGGPARNGWAVFDGGLLIALLPPGAFFALALLIAARNMLKARQAARVQSSHSESTTP